MWSDICKFDKNWGVKFKQLLPSCLSLIQYLVLLLGSRVRNQTSTPTQDMAITNTNHHQRKM